MLSYLSLMQNQPLKEFLARVEILSAHYKASASNISSLRVTQYKLGEMLEDFVNQAYKYAYIQPGELIALTSTMAVKNQYKAFATCNGVGQIAFVLYDTKRMQWFDVTSETHPKDWHSADALNTKLENLLNSIESSESSESCLPQVVQSYIGDNKALYLGALKENFNKIRFLNNGNRIVIFSMENNPLPYPLVIIKYNSGEYVPCIEYKQDCLVELDYHLNYLEKYRDVYLDPEAIALMARLQKAKDKLFEETLNNTLNDRLAKSISKSDLLSIYEYLLTHERIPVLLANQQAVRIDKVESRLPRTVNIVRGQNQTYLAMLETKSKKANGNNKSGKSELGSGTYGMVKRAWRLDGEVLEPWANKGFYSEVVEEADREFYISQNIIQSGNECEPTAWRINGVNLGALYAKNNKAKRSVYSPEALGSVSDFKDCLSDAEKWTVIQDILEGVYMIHQQGKVHHDLKLKNILLYKQAGNYRAKINDFDGLYDFSCPRQDEARASIGCESPEILISTQRPDAQYHDYFHSPKRIDVIAFDYFRRTRDTRPVDAQTDYCYRIPDPANDMWAVGISIFELLYGYLPRGTKRDIDLIRESRLLTGLLDLRRSTRLLSVQALRTFYEMHPNATRLPTFEAFFRNAKRTHEDSENNKRQRLAYS